MIASYMLDLITDKTFIGTIIGAFLAVLGGVFVFYLQSNSEKKKQLEKNTLIILSLVKELNNFKNATNELHKLIENNKKNVLVRPTYRIIFSTPKPIFFMYETHKDQLSSLKANDFHVIFEVYSQLHYLIHNLEVNNDIIFRFRDLETALKRESNTRLEQQDLELNLAANRINLQEQYDCIKNRVESYNEARAKLDEFLKKNPQYCPAED